MSKAKTVATDATEQTQVINAETAATEKRIVDGVEVAPQFSETLPAVSTNQALASAENFGDVSFEFENENQIVEVTAAYLAMEEGETKDFIFMGMSTTEFADDHGEMKEKEIVSLLDKEKNSFISAATVLVSACKRIKHVPCLIRIVHKGKVKLTGGRQYDNFAMLTSPVNL